MAEIVLEVVDRQRLLRIDAAWLGRVVRRALAREGIAAAELCVLLVRDRQMATLHEEWLGIPGPTDVITFDLAPVPRRHGLHGDIAVSTETALGAARELGWPPRCEVAYYVIHGLLHLAGYDDRAPVARQAMRRRERVLMTAAGLPRPPRRPVARGVS